MQIAKLINDGDGQIVHLPDGFHFNGDQVHIRQAGDGVLLMPTENAWQIMLDSLDQFSDDIFENGRFHQNHNPAAV